MIVLVYPFLGLAVAGFVILLAVHIAALSGSAYLFDHSVKFLAPGLFVVWIPTVLVTTRLTRDFKQKDLWRAALRGCPRWMQRANWILFGYVWVGFFVLPLVFGGGMELRANVARTFSAVLLAFYAVASCVLYSALHVEKLDEARRCLNGHQVSPLAKYCEECGAPVQIPPNLTSK